MKKQKLLDPNKTKLNPVWLSAIATALSRKYNVTVVAGKYWAMDIENKTLMYNDSILNLSEDDAMALILHEVGHLTNTGLINKNTKVYKEAPESSITAVNHLEDIRVDFIMSHEYVNSNKIISKFNEHATAGIVETLSTLQYMQKEYDKDAQALLTDLDKRLKRLDEMGTPHIKMDDTDKFMQVINNIGYRPQMERPVDEIFMLATLMYHSGEHNISTKQMLENYRDKKQLDLAKKVHDKFKYQVEHMESTDEVQEFWEKEIYPILKETIDKDQKTKRQPKPGPGQGGSSETTQKGGQESDAFAKPGGINGMGNMQIDVKNGTVVSKSSGMPVSEGQVDNKDMRGEKVTKAESTKQAQGYAKKAAAIPRQVRWDDYKNKIKGYISTAKTQLNRTLKENMYNRYHGRFSSGKLNIKKLYKFPLKDFKLFRRKGEIKDKDYAFSILVDVSGSMDGPRLEETMKGVVLMTETLGALDQPVEITFFSSGFKTPKKFNTIIDPIEIGHQAGQIINGGTDIKDPFDLNLKSLIAQPTKEKIMITLTDGDFSGTEKKHIQSMQDKHPKVLHYGIGIDVNLSDVFPGDRAINIKDVSEIMPAFSRILKRHIKK